MRIKHYRKMIPWILILLCIFLLKSYESSFQHVQKLLVLESNNLLSPHYIQAREDMNTIWKQSAKSGETFWIFGMIENRSARQVIAFYANDYKQVTFPLKTGTRFSTMDSGEAIVGTSVQTYKLNDGEYLDYNNVRYHVIGIFGIAEDSPLKNTVLLNNSALLEQSDVPLVFDGPHIDQIAWLKGFSLGNKGIERWLNITFIVNWIRYMTWLVILCASVLAMHYYLVITKESRILLLEIGIGPRAIFRKGIWHIAAFAFIMVSVVTLAVKGETPFFEFVMSSAVIYGVLLAAYSVMFWQRIPKETTHRV